MISWIKGQLVETWLDNQKYYILINCLGLGYEVQTLSTLDKSIKGKEITLWIQQIRREDCDLLYGFYLKEERDFFREILNIKGIGPQIGMSLLNKYNLKEIIDSLSEGNKDLISTVPGIGKKMTERIFFELRNKLNSKNYNSDSNNSIYKDSDIKKTLDDIFIALESLDYPKKQIKETIKILIDNQDKENYLKKDIRNLTFENLLKKALDLIEQKSRNFVP